MTIAVAPINSIVVTRKKVTMHKENEVNCRKGFRYIRRKRLASGSAESSSSREGDEARTSFLFLLNAPRFSLNSTKLVYSVYWK